MAQWGYDFLLGAAMGAIGGSPQLARGIRAGKAAAVQDGTTTQGTVEVPQLVDAEGKTYQQREAAKAFNNNTTSDAEGALRLLQSNMKSIENMEPVVRVTGEEIGKNGKVTERVYNFFQSIGGKVWREGFGDVLFSKGKVKNSMIGHGIGNAKIELSAAVPGVIEKGKQINYTPNWKGRGYDSFVFAAPVEYRGEKTYVTVIVIKDTANRYYLHEAVDAQGNMIFKKEEGPNVASDTPAETPRNHVANIEPSIEHMIPQGQKSVNTEPLAGGAERATNNVAAQEGVKWTEETRPPSISEYMFDQMLSRSDALSAELDAEITAKRAQTPAMDAVLAVSEEVRQDVVSPDTAEAFLRDVYGKEGLEGLQRLVNAGNGNLTAEAWKALLNAETTKVQESAAVQGAEYIPEEMPVLSKQENGRKEAQFAVIEQTNPFDEELGNHTWIKTPEDILTYQEAIDNYGGIGDVTPDFVAADVQKALNSGEVTVYSSHPIEPGAFVTPSQMEAKNYAGEEAVYSKRVPLEDVAWVDEIQGQYTGPVTAEAPSLVQDGSIIRKNKADPAEAMTWQEVYGYENREDAPPESTESPLSETERAEVDDYLDKLARDENVFSGDPYTLSDAVYDAKLRGLEKTEAPPEIGTREQLTQADLDELASLFEDQANRIGTKEEMTADMVLDEALPKKESARAAAREAWDYFYRKMVDAGHSVTKLAEAMGDPYLYQFYNQARASSSAGVNMITEAQTNVLGQRVGDSLTDVFLPIRAKGGDYYRAFETYMFDLHNIERMSLSKNKMEKVEKAREALREFDANNPDIKTDTAAQLHRMTENTDPEIAELARERERLLRELDRAEDIKDKPVFDYEFTAEDSRARAERLLREHPEFTEYQAQVRKYIDNLMQYRVDSGLMTQEDADFLKTYYPNYVPTMRMNTDDGAGRGRALNTVRIGKTVGRAQGGNSRLMPLHQAMGKQTMKVVREGSKNRFADRLLRSYLQAGNTEQINRYVKEASQHRYEFNPDALNDAAVERPTKDKTVTAYMDGKLWEMTVDDTLFDAVKALSPDARESNRLTKMARSANNLFKSLVTGYNPAFLARNVIRDLQTAGLNTRDAAAFAKNYPRAINEIRNEGAYWQLYKSMGGVYSSVFDYATGTVREPKGKLGKFAARVEALNMAAEQAPRLAEFIGVLEKAEAAKQRGETVSDMAARADALYAAADVTVNFGRSGTLGKVLNANYVPFLNPGVQGFDKLIRRVAETKGAKEWTKLVIRAAALGIAPALLNALLYHDDEEWDDLRDSDKDTNYMFKLRNGYWLKIPKGRELSLFGIAADRVMDAAKGERVDILSTLNTMGNQVAPANPLTSNIFSALIDSQLLNPDSPGRTWYGGNIESQRLQNYAPGERYDSSTDAFSKAVGKALGISPKKLNYVLDQYSGVLGDFLLPVLTPQAERNPLAKAFTVDVQSSNRVSGDFYDEANALKYAKNGGDEAAGVVSRWWSKQQSACSDIWKQIREVEASKELNNKEKLRQVRELKAIVTGIQKNAMAAEDVYRAAVEKYLSAGLDADTAYRNANRDCFGAEYALQLYNKDVYAKAQSAKQSGVAYDAFYNYYFDTKDLQSTKNGSAAYLKMQYLANSGLSEDEQAELYFADLASDRDLITQAELEMDAGITPAQYYLYRQAVQGMTKREEKLAAIDALDLTEEQKNALYFANGYSEKTLGKAPWYSGVRYMETMPILSKKQEKMPILSKKEEVQGGSEKMPVLSGRTQSTGERMPVLSK